MRGFGVVALMAAAVVGIGGGNWACAGPLVIDTTGGTSPTGIYSFGEPTTATIGQVLTAPAVANVLRDFTFYFDDFLDNGHDLAEFQFFVYSWNSTTNRIQGAPLFTSAAMSSTNNGGLGGFEALKAEIGIELTPGQQYMAFASAINLFDGDDSFGTVLGRTDNSYTGGNYYFNNTQTFHLLPLTNWTTFGGDLQFVATFVPEPGAWVMRIAAAMAAVVLGRRRPHEAATR